MRLVFAVFPCARRHGSRGFLHAGRAKGCIVSEAVRLHRWDEIALEKVTEMISRKFVTGHREMLAQVYLKRGAVVPVHAHESEQLSYVLQGALKFLVGGEPMTVREGEVLQIPSWVEHQVEALEDTFVLDMFSPIRQDWLDKTDDYFRT
jgi:unsaturated pyranuronate lyase